MNYSLSNKNNLNNDNWLEKDLTLKFLFFNM